MHYFFMVCTKEETLFSLEFPILSEMNLVPKKKQLSATLFLSDDMKNDISMTIHDNQVVQTTKLEILPFFTRKENRAVAFLWGF